jgi:type II secretory pathway component PulM
VSHVLLGVLRAKWNQLDARPRRRYRMAAALLAAGGAIGLAAWLQAEHAQLSLRVGEAAAELKAVREQIGEIERLKKRPVQSPLAGTALQAAVSASLQSRGLPLSVAMVDSARMHVQGVADFDEVVRWLADVSQSQRLRLTSMSASRQGETAKLDLVLSAAQE